MHHECDAAIEVDVLPRPALPARRRGSSPVAGRRRAGGRNPPSRTGAEQRAAPARPRRPDGRSGPAGISAHARDSSISHAGTWAASPRSSRPARTSSRSTMKLSASKRRHRAGASRRPALRPRPLPARRKRQVAVVSHSQQQARGRGSRRYRQQPARRVRSRAARHRRCCRWYVKSAAIPRGNHSGAGRNAGQRHFQPAPHPPRGQQDDGQHARHRQE